MIPLAGTLMGFLGRNALKTVGEAALGGVIGGVFSGGDPTQIALGALGGGIGHLGGSVVRGGLGKLGATEAIKDGGYMAANLAGNFAPSLAYSALSSPERESAMMTAATRPTIGAIDYLTQYGRS